MSGNNDLRALMRQKKQERANDKYSGKSKQELLELLLEKKKMAKLRAEEEKKAAAQKKAMPPPANPKKTPVASKITVGMDAAAKKKIKVSLPSHDDEKAQPGSMPAQVPAGLPIGFFDTNQSQETPSPSESIQSPEIKATEVKGEDTVTTSAVDGLPENFFDDPVADAKAKGIDVEAKKKEDARKEWEEFQKFAKTVEKAEQEEDLMIEEAAGEREHEQSLEHMAQMTRLADLLHKSEKVKVLKESGVKIEDTPLKGPGGDLPDTSTLPNIVDKLKSEEIDAISSVSIMLKRKKRRKKDADAEANEGDYVPLDALDWRSKAI